MRFRSLNATFGRFERRTLDLAPGLNIIEAPNEAGKSTLAAFLRIMLYGLPTRERGAAADKNRYAPWSGSAMQGRLELESDSGGLITLTRDTARANSPMGRFSAVYTGSGEPAPLTSADCGETLTGVPRRVYERSAFIGQGCVAVDSDAELERRIASLITSGEEGVTYSEAEAVLRRQLNARKHNKTGRIPALDAEISEAERALEELRALTGEHAAAEAALADCSARAETLRAELERHDLADVWEQRQTVLEAEAAYRSAQAEADRLRRTLSERKLPDREALEQSRARLLSLAPLRDEAAQAAQRRSDREAALLSFDAGSKSETDYLPYIIVSFAVLLAFFFISAIPAAVSLAGKIASLTALIYMSAHERLARTRRKARAAERNALERELHEAQADAIAQQRLYDSAVHELLAALPVTDLSQAPAYIDEGLSLWAEFARLTRAAQDAGVRCETLAAQSGGRTCPAEPTERPTQSREALRTALADCTEKMREAQRRSDYTAGRGRALGEPAELESALAEKRAERETLRSEYDALCLAMDALAQANSTLQSRFSPALGRCAAGFFSRLTGGKYRAVLLDRTFNASAEETDDPIARDVSLLSRGAADQLYLAVRLAICSLVLPKDRRVPLVLDDALVRFDDERCAAALELLLEESRTRQILLLTCQHREARLLAGREGVRLLSL